MLRNLFATGVATVLVFTSCSGNTDGVTRYPLSGGVTLNGKPVQSGNLSIEPDSGKGNRGPGVYIEIQNGRFETMAQDGTVGGPHIIRLAPTSLESGSAPDAVASQFAPVTMEIDLPKKKAELDLEFQSKK